MQYSFYELIDLGVFYITDYDDDGEPLFNVNMEKAREFAPEIYQEELDAIDRAILQAIDTGDIIWDATLLEDGTLEETWIPTTEDERDG